MKTLRAIFRLIRFLSSLVFHAIPLWIRAARGPIDWDHHQAVRQRFAKSAMRILGIQLTVLGDPYTEGPCVYASNHRSWLDPFVDLSVLWAFPVAKAEVGQLPFVAPGARATGILFVDRGSRSSRQATVEAMIKALKDGFSILIYPEGTTSTEVGTRTFRRGAFTVAQDAKVPVVPLTITYTDPSYYWGEGESLWDNFVQIAGAKTTDVTLHIGSPHHVEDSARAMHEIRGLIDEQILAAAH